MKRYRLEEAQATFLSGLGLLALGLLVTFAISQVTSGGFVVVTTGLIIVGGIRTLIGLFQLLGAATLPADASTKWPARTWIPDPFTVGLLNLNVLGLGYLYQSRWVAWLLRLGLVSFLIYCIVRLGDEPVLAFVFISLLTLALIFSAILSNGAAHNEKRVRPTLPVRNDPRLRTAAIVLVVAQILLLLALPGWWMLSSRSGNKIGNAAVDLTLSGDCDGAMSLTGELSTIQRRLLQRGELDSDSTWLRLEPICKDIVAGAGALKGGNYQTAKEKFASARGKTLGVESLEVLRVQAYNGEAEATLRLATKYVSQSGQLKSALIEFLTLVNKFPDTAARQTADLIVPDLSLRVAAHARAAGDDPSYWYEQLVLHYPESPQAETARIALEDLK